MEEINVSDVKINDAFLQTVPSERKINRVKRYVETFGRFDVPVVLDSNGFLVDGYVRYLVAKEMNIDQIPFVQLEKMQYMVGKFEKSNKVYTWKNDRNIDLHVGDHVLVKTKSNGKKTRDVVVVEDIFFADSLELYKEHKSVIKNLERY